MNINEARQRLLDNTRALQWWSRNLGVPLTNGELMLFEKIIENMLDTIKTLDKEI